MKNKEPSSLKKDVNIAYILLCHTDPAFIGHLVKTLRYKDDYVFIHVDKKIDIQPFLKECKDEPNAFFVPEEKKSY